MIQLSTQGKKQYSTFNYERYLISNAYFVHQSLVRKPEFAIRVRILGEVNVLGLINKVHASLLVRYLYNTKQGEIGSYKIYIFHALMISL